MYSFTKETGEIANTETYGRYIVVATIPIISRTSRCLTLKKTTIYNGKILNLSIYEGVLNGRSVKREIVEHHGAAAILALDDDNNAILVRQDRFPHGSTLEIPAGTLEDGESPEQCAARELREETGYLASHMKPLVSFYPSVGYSTEVIHCFVATRLQLSADGPDPDDDESISIVRMPWTQLLKMIGTSNIQDSKTVCAVLTHAAATPTHL